MRLAGDAARHRMIGRHARAMSPSARRARPDRDAPARSAPCDRRASPCRCRSRRRSARRAECGRRDRRRAGLLGLGVAEQHAGLARMRKLVVGFGGRAQWQLMNLFIGSSCAAVPLTVVAHCCDVSVALDRDASVAVDAADRARRHGRADDRRKPRSRPRHGACARGMPAPASCWRRPSANLLRPGGGGDRGAPRTTAARCALSADITVRADCERLLAASIVRRSAACSAGEQCPPPGARPGPAAGRKLPAVLAVEPGHLAGDGERQRQRHLPALACRRRRISSRRAGAASSISAPASANCRTATTRPTA